MSISLGSKGYLLLYQKWHEQSEDEGAWWLRGEILDFMTLQ